MSESKYLAKSSDFVVVHQIPTKLLRYGVLESVPDIPNHIDKPPSHLVKSKTIPSLSSTGGNEFDNGEGGCESAANNKRQAHRMSNLLILVIPGNPGVIDYYEVFMRSLYVKLNQIVPVWGVSHAGHVKPPSIYAQLFRDASSSSHARDNYNLNGQIEHKITFIKRFIPRTVKLILVGHSIGAYICLEILDQMPELNVVKTILLFPTIERMAATPQGSVVHPLCQYRWLVLPPQYALYFVPTFVKEQILSWYFGKRRMDDSCYKATLELFNPQCAQNVLYLGNDELNTVKQLKTDVIRNHLRKIIFFYGATDPWCPARYCEDMKSLFPDAEIYLCDDSNIEHAFVLESGVEVAIYVHTWVADTIKSLTK